MTGERRESSRRTGLLAIAVGVVAALAVVAFLLTRQPSEPPAGQASPTASASASPTRAATQEPTATPTATPPTAWDWAVHPLPGGPIRAGAHIGESWVALDNLQAWTSGDGADWTDATVDPGPDRGGTTQMGPVTQMGDTWYSVGNWFSGNEQVFPFVWSTQDGSTWDEVVPSQPWGYLANDVANDGSQLAVAGNVAEFGLGHVWTSPDGSTWIEHDSDGGPSTMNAIHGDEDGFVSVGYRLDDAGNSLATIWHSADGETWTDAELPATDQPVALIDVVRMPSGRYLALGVVGVQIDAGAFVIWYADDPATWTAGAELPGGALPGLLLAVDGGALAITNALDGPSVRFSADGTTWEEVADFVQADRPARASAAATDGSTVVILGGTLEADANYAWVGTPLSE